MFNALIINKQLIHDDSSLFRLLDPLLIVRYIRIYEMYIQIAKKIIIAYKYSAIEQFVILVLYRIDSE